MAGSVSPRLPLSVECLLTTQNMSSNVDKLLDNLMMIHAVVTEGPVYQYLRVQLLLASLEPIPGNSGEAFFRVPASAECLAAVQAKHC